jgi:hypothetical protein
MPTSNPSKGAKQKASDMTHRRGDAGARVDRVVKVIDGAGSLCFNTGPLRKPFMIGRTEVKQGQWKKVMGTEPWKQSKRYFKEGANYPATFVS